MHCGDQRHLGLCLGYVPALAYGSCRVSDKGTNLHASDLHNARATILNPFNKGFLSGIIRLHYCLDRAPVCWYWSIDLQVSIYLCSLFRIIHVFLPWIRTIDLHMVVSLAWPSKLCQANLNINNFIDWLIWFYYTESMIHIYWFDFIVLTVW